MPRSRLFRSIVLFGTSLGAGAGVVAAVSSLSSGCDLYFPRDPGPTRTTAWPIIDAPVETSCTVEHPCDAWGIIDASIVDGWGTIADAPTDAGHKPDGAP